jgi:hypothetical protein
LGGSGGGEAGGGGAQLLVLGCELFEARFLLGFELVELVEGHGVDVYGVAA